MRTTIILNDEMYSKLVSEAVERHGSVKRLSQTLNELLLKHFQEKQTPTSMFGSMKKLDLKDLREEGDPHESS